MTESEQTPAIDNRLRAATVGAQLICVSFGYGCFSVGLGDYAGFTIYSKSKLFDGTIWHGSDDQGFRARLCALIGHRIVDLRISDSYFTIDFDNQTILAFSETPGDGDGPEAAVFSGDGQTFVWN